MDCPYKHHTSLKQLPCSWISHPHDENIRVCDVCQNHYDVREIGLFFPRFLSFVAIAIAILILSSVILSERDPQTPTVPTSEYRPTETIKTSR